MGKKSKGSKAKPKSNASAGGSSTILRGGGIAGAAGGAIVSSKKAQKCVRCFGTVKAEKGTRCPGCSQLYCWRCERKAFGTCPNGDPTRRCLNCSSGKTFLRVMKTREGLELGKMKSIPSWAWCRLKKHTESDNSFSKHACPFIICPGDGCSISECCCCADDASVRLMYCCVNHDQCATYRCVDCSKRNFLEVNDRFSSFGGILCRCRSETLLKGSASLVSLEEFARVMRRDGSDIVATCRTCLVSVCVSCMDSKSLHNMLETVIHGGKEDYHCSSCYWRNKPCTNPTCPNEIGVPTKRCGDCHVARYCSVQCQAAAYPDHVGRCKKILAKRAAGVAVAAEKD